MRELLIGIIDTGVNPWHSHVGGGVRGCHLYADRTGNICEDDDFSDQTGHGTAVAGVLREALPRAAFFAVRVFEKDFSSYPSLLARAILRAGAERCDIINLSLALPPGVGGKLVSEACQAVRNAGSILVAAGHPDNQQLLPASLAGVYGVISDDALKEGETQMNGPPPYPCRARGLSRSLDNIPAESNLKGRFAGLCACHRPLLQRRLIT